MDLQNKTEHLPTLGPIEYKSWPLVSDNATVPYLKEKKWESQTNKENNPFESSEGLPHSSFTIDEDSSVKASNTSSKGTLTSRIHRGKEALSGISVKNLFLSDLGRWLTTFLLSVGYIAATIHWTKISAMSTYQKRFYNTLATGISISLGLNISSAFRSIVFKLRWPILAWHKQDLTELENVLQADSMIKIISLIFTTRRHLIRVFYTVWLAINILSQVGLAMISLTYSFDTDQRAVQWTEGKSAVPILDHFYPQTNHAVTNLTLNDEEYMAHTYGGFALNYGIGLTVSKPRPGQIYLTADPLLWIDKSKNLVEFIFLDSPTGSRLIEPFSAFSERKINLGYNCSSHNVLKGGNGKSSRITIDNIGDIFISQPVPDSTTYMTRRNHTCVGNNRCSVIEAFESSATDPWYYICEISLGSTQNDPQRVSEISDYMARIATASIAQIGYRQITGLSAQIYPRESMWGKVAMGKSNDIGMLIGIYALASIAGAAQYNPFKTHMALAPSPGFELNIKHPKTFYLIFFSINFIHLTLVVMAYIISMRIKYGPSGYLGMSLLLKPITDRLLRINKNANENAFKEALLNTYVRYEENPTNKDDWSLNISHR